MTQLLVGTKKGLFVLEGTAGEPFERLLGVLRKFDPGRLLPFARGIVGVEDLRSV